MGGWRAARWGCGPAMAVSTIADLFLDQADLSSPAYAKFRAERLTSAQVVWLNTTWFCEQDIDVTDPEVRSIVSKALLDLFAYDAVPIKAMSVSVIDLHEFAADRYGEVGPAPHGGSGRNGIRSGYQVKGIGPTPLVGLTVDFGHSHGYLSLEEGIREAIYSEVFRTNCPYGACPSVAVIDTKKNIRNEEGQVGVRRGLIIRPFVRRISHLLRAYAFRSITDPWRSPILDRLRTIGLLEEFCSFEEDLDSRKQAAGKGLETLCTRVADQIGYCRAHRLTHGAFFPSSLGWDGALIDFGAARTLPSWRRTRLMPNTPCFGDEVDTMLATLSALLFHLEKYVGVVFSDVEKSDIKEVLAEGVHSSFERHCVQMWSFENPNECVSARKIADRCSEAYRSAQARKPFGLTDLELAKQERASMLFLFESVSKMLLDDASTDGEVQRILARCASAKRYFLERDCVDRDDLQINVFDLIGGPNSDADVEANSISRFVDTTVDNYQRNWSTPAR
jgi:hypothetical protein